MQFVFAFIVAFYLCAPLAAVLLACIPLIGLSGTLLINAVTAARNQALEQYAAAGGLASESLGAIRTVSALNAQPAVIKKYKSFLNYAMDIGIKKGAKRTVQKYIYSIHSYILFIST